MKEDRYTEALNTAKMWYRNTAMPDNVKEIFRRIFPELKENEEEQNIKDLIDELKCSLRAANCQNDACGGGHEKRIALLEWSIAWLEKQGEQKPVEEVEPKFKVGDWVMNAPLSERDKEVENFVKSKRKELEKMIPGFVDNGNLTDIVLNFYERGIRDGIQMMSDKLNDALAKNKKSWR